MKNILLIFLVLSVISMNLVDGKSLRKQLHIPDVLLQTEVQTESETDMKISTKNSSEMVLRNKSKGTIWYHPSVEKCVAACKALGHYSLSFSDQWWGCGYFYMINDYDLKHRPSYYYTSVNC